MTKHLLLIYILSFVVCLAGLLSSLPAYTQTAQNDQAVGQASSRASGAPAPSGTSPSDIESLFSDDANGNDSSAGQDEQLSSDKPADRPDDKGNRSAGAGATGASGAPSTSGSTSAARRNVPQNHPKEMSDLGKLEPLKDIAVIQKRYLPKTGRFEFFVGGSLVMNDVFFSNYGLSARMAYYFQERYGVEFVGLFLSNNPRQVVGDLSDRGVATKSFIATKDYYGVDFKWSPIYGKMTLRNKSITPFDMYFSSGLGLTGTNQSGSAATLHLGTGQVFAITKGMAFRWDLSWNFFNATSSVSGSNSSSLYNNLLATLGVSFFFPEATYR